MECSASAPPAALVGGDQDEQERGGHSDRQHAGEDYQLHLHRSMDRDATLGAVDTRVHDEVLRSVMA
jgi:hypothetical protein